MVFFLFREARVHPCKKCAAKLEEDRQRRKAEKARKAAEVERLNILNYRAIQEKIREIARAREEARRAHEEEKRKKKARHPLLVG